MSVVNIDSILPTTQTIPPCRLKGIACLINPRSSGMSSNKGSYDDMDALVGQLFIVEGVEDDPDHLRATGWSMTNGYDGNEWELVHRFPSA